MVRSLVPASLLSCLFFVHEASAQSETEVFFEKSVRPLFVKRCLDCHSEDNAESELRIDSLNGLLKGGLRGPAIVRGKPEESLLIRAVRHGEQLKMPARKKLPAEEIAILAQWISDGAAWPHSKSVEASYVSTPEKVGFTEDQQNFWAFRPPQRSRLPDVQDSDWPASPIDRFILARLEAAGHRPAPQADERTLLRRAAFALTGLPPTPSQMNAFLADQSPAAFTQAVTRLLDSPGYGEKWGRHWLDVARYADSNGLDENLAHANAFRYRDYVIAAFNADKPIDRFLQEQIAGDLLHDPRESTAERIARLPATGFLSIGPKMLAEDDGVKMQMDIIDEQIDTLGRAFLGLTFGCARCHDHKFDPIPTGDYYSLAGIFKSTRTMDTFTVVAKWHERPMATPEAIAARNAHQKKIDDVAVRISAVRDAAAGDIRDAAITGTGDYLLAAENRRREMQQLKAARPYGQNSPDSLPAGSILREAENFERGNVLRESTAYGKGIGVLVNAGPTPNHVEYDIVLAHDSRFQFEVRYAAASARACRLTVNGTLIQKNIADGVTGTWFPDSQRWDIEGFVDLVAGKNTIRIEQPTFFPHIDKILLVPVSTSPPALQPLDSERKLVAAFVEHWTAFLNAENPGQLELATKWKIIAADQSRPERLRRLARNIELLLADGNSRAGTEFQDATAIRSFIRSDQGPFRLSDSIETAFQADVAVELKMLREQKTALDKSIPALPSAMAVEEGPPEDVRIHYRGSHLTQGVAVPRRFPQILAGDQQPEIREGSGRKELAMWLTSRGNPLTARVFVNRVWQWHFGAGLVRTPDNFGRLGERPTHPELLDWLAVDLMESGWSLKRLHRQILHSSTWQQSIHPSAHAAVEKSVPVTDRSPSILKSDPENRLWGRMNRRRLTAEEIRDSILTLSGQLDRSMGGSILPTENRAYVTSTANVNPDVYRSNRRSVYLPVVRSALYEVLQAFDFADPSVMSGRRQSTTVAAQALFMMNSEFVSRQTRFLAERVVEDDSRSDPEHIASLWQRAVGRRPDVQELQNAVEFLNSYERRWRASVPDSGPEAQLRSWQSLSRALIATNEFVFVE